jgi:coproporphyrinogen III oxidase-like Fe-S oxidoreductase
MAGTRTVLSRAELVDTFSRIGNEMKEGRIAGLSSSGLIHRDGGSWRLTAAGRLLANLLRAVFFGSPIFVSG